ncbi:hypothetical protein FACS1894160_2040 [Bacteroidia bacterium]|nr:hypothetical protein FACS1894160_2040 [Bacteroidia bacterium]
MKKNVHELTMSRLGILFNEFDNIYISFSGGKDSSVLLNLCIQYVRENNLNVKIGVFHMDYEVQYHETLRYIDRVFRANPDIIEVYRVCVPFKVSTCTSMYQTFWRPWDDACKEFWVREIPPDSYTKNHFPFYDGEMWDYDFQTLFAQWYHQLKNAKKTCCLVGIRTQESYHRWKAIHGNKRRYMYRNLQWTHELADNIYNAYAIYDWLTTDSFCK